MQEPVNRPGNKSSIMPSLQDFLEPLWVKVGKNNKPVNTRITCRMDEDYIQEVGSYHEGTDSDRISGLTEKDDKETESEIATTSQAILTEAPRHTPIVYDTNVQQDIDKPLDYHVQKEKHSRNMRSTSRTFSPHQRLDIQCEDNQQIQERGWPENICSTAQA